MAANDMSFLAAEDDQLATLEVALAFIDACDDGTSSTSVSSSNGADSPASQELGSCAVAHKVQTHRAQQQQSRVAVTSSSAGTQRSLKAKSNASAVTRHRERKKAEMIALRTEAVELEAQLARLKSSRIERGDVLQYLLQQQQQQHQGIACGGSSKQAAGIQPKQVSIWLDIAATQARERSRAENLNLKLKDAIEKNSHVSKALQDIFGKKLGQYGLDLLLDEQKQLLFNDSAITQQAMVFEDLRALLQQMYITADFLFDPQAGWTLAADSISSAMQVKEDAGTGSYIEVCMNTPLRFDFREVGELMWQQITQMQADPNNSKYCLKKRFLTDASFQKSFTMVVDGPDGPVELRGASHVERFVEANRVISMWTSRLLAPHDGPRFVEKGWLVTSTVGAGSLSEQSTSLLRTCYQVSCDSRGEVAARDDPRTSLLIEMVKRTLATKTRNLQQHMQNMLSFGTRPMMLYERAMCG